MREPRYLPKMSQPANVSALFPSPRKSKGPWANTSWRQVLGSVPETQALRQLLDRTREPPVGARCATGETATQDYGPTVGATVVTEPKLGSARQLAVKPIY